MSKTTRISRTTALEMIKNSGGRFLGVEFKKKDNSIRKMNCRYYNSSGLGVITVYDMALVRKKAKSTYRSFNINNLLGFSLNSNIYRVR